MTSFTVTFTGKTSVLRADFFPEITLDPNANYCCALLDFTTYNSIPNVIENQNNEIKFNCQNEQSVTISLPSGAYEVEDILKYLKWEFDAHQISFTYEISAASSSVGIEFDTDVEWIDGTLLNVIGFENKKTFEKNTTYKSERIVKITNIDIIRIECDIVSGSYINGKLSHTIHQFSHCKVDPGYKFIEVPRHLIYLPVKEKHLQSIQIAIVDQNGRLINFRGEQISCRIHIKKVDYFGVA